MDWSKVHRKLAGRFRLLERRNEDGDCVIHCFGSLGQTGVNNDDVRYICGFYSLPYREDWRREEARDAGDSFYLLIKKKERKSALSALIKSIGQNLCKFITGPGRGIFLYPALLFGADMARVKSIGIILQYFII